MSWESVSGFVRQCGRRNVADNKFSLFAASSEVMTSHFQSPTQGGSSQPSSPAHAPRVYTSVAEMKRSKGKVGVVCSNLKWQDSHFDTIFFQFCLYTEVAIKILSSPSLSLKSCFQISGNYVFIFTPSINLCSCKLKLRV